MPTSFRLMRFGDFEVVSRLYAPGARQRRHTHERSSITAVVCGEIVEAADAGTFRGRSGSVVVKPAGVEHEDAFLGRAAVRTISIQFDDASMPAFAWRDDAHSARAAVALCVALSRSQSEIEAAAHALIAAAAPRDEHSAPDWLRSLRATLDRDFAEPLRFDALAHDHGVHPVYMARAFRRATGMTMGDYVRAARVRHARHLLASTDASLIAIAQSSGFVDASHLCRTFARAMNVTPIRFRGLVRRLE